ncbi:MAG: carboxypeptidase regulatory-like domain-containing protein, partial [Acidobacteriaceae bacterium]|nr:carboxypeptidase regulatory-like domain-containing protein [Acidobacteriaceae bacterium]
GEPVESMGLQVMLQEINNGRIDWIPRGGAQTDENGEYEIEDLPPGQYLIRTSTRAVFFVNAPSQGSPYTDVYPAQFFPNAPDRSSAQPVTVGPGQTAEADFRLSPVPSYSITGTVSGPQNVTVMCEDEEGNSLSFGRVNHRTNQFRLIHIPPGTCTVTAHFQGPNGEAYYAEQPVTVNSSNITGVQLALQPLPDIPVHFSNSPGGMPVQLQLISRQKRRRQGQLHPMTEGSPPDHQTLVFKGVLPGSYQVQANSFSRTCIGSISSGGTDLLREDLTVVNGSAQGAPIEVSLRDDCATLTLAADASPGVNVNFLLVPNSVSMQPRVMSVGSGSLSIPGLTPGEYTVYALSDISDLEYANPEAMRKFSGQKVTLGPGETAKMQLNLITNGGSQ